MTISITPPTSIHQFSPTSGLGGGTGAEADGLFGFLFALVDGGMLNLDPDALDGSEGADGDIAALLAQQNAAGANKAPVDGNTLTAVTSDPGAETALAGMPEFARLRQALNQLKNQAVQAIDELAAEVQPRVEGLAELLGGKGGAQEMSFADLMGALRRSAADLETDAGLELSELGDTLDIDHIAPAREGGSSISSLTYTSTVPGGGAVAPVDIATQIRNFADFLANRIDGTVRVVDKQIQANLELYPPDLGQVRVELTLGAERSVEANFYVERGETRQMLTQNLRHFTEALGNQGLTVDKVRVMEEARTVRPGESRSDAGAQDKHENAGRGRDGETFQRSNQRSAGRQASEQAWEELLA